MSRRAARPLLEDMLAYSREAVELVDGRTGPELLADRMRFLAVTRALEVIGEAAAQIPDLVRQALPSIPLRQSADMRNRLIHGYGAVSPAILADTARDDLPGLIKSLEAVLAAALPDETS